MDNSINITSASSKHPCSESWLLEQEDITDVKEKVKCFNKAVESVESTISFKLQLDEYIDAEFYGKDNKSQGVVKIIPFKLGGREFNTISGNYKDESLSATISKESSKKEISFTIVKPHSTDRKYTPELIWQERFIKCIEDGMVSFMKADYDANAIAPNTGGKKYCEYYNTRELLPTCVQFTRYLMLGTTSYMPGQYKATKAKPEYIYKDFSVVAILDGSQLIHNFIHIAEGVCLGKLGDSCIIFHTVKAIFDFYQNTYGKSFDLAAIEYDS